jgi:hypothetical protein
MDRHNVVHFTLPLGVTLSKWIVVVTIIMQLGR